MRALLLGSVILVFGSVAGATIIDLTAGGIATLNNGVILDATVAATSVGTGVIDSFDRIQASGTESGYNTDANNVLDNKGGVFTHSLLVSGLDATTKPGYYTFLLDINQTGDLPLLSLDAIQFFTATTGTVNHTPTPAGGTGVTGPIYDFANTVSAVCTNGAVCTAGTNQIRLNYSLNSGSGNGFDMFLYVPTGLLGALNPNSFFYLYSAFGGQGGVFASNDGFEEWARVNATGQVVPEPISSALVGTGLIALFFLRRRATR
jgi:hypothetical protein